MSKKEKNLQRMRMLMSGRLKTGDFVRQGDRRNRLKRSIEALIAREEIDGYFAPSFQPGNKVDRQGKELLKIIKTKEDVASLIPTYSQESWFQDLLVGLTLEHIRYPSGRSGAEWAEGFDVLGAYHFLVSKGFQKGAIHQFLAEELKVPGAFNSQSKTTISHGAETVRDYIRGHEKCVWDPVTYPEHTIQAAIKK